LQTAPSLNHYFAFITLLISSELDLTLRICPSTITLLPGFDYFFRFFDQPLSSLTNFKVAPYEFLSFSYFSHNRSVFPSNTHSPLPI